MDLNDLRSVVTVISLFAFLGIVAWAWSRKNRSAFDEAAQLPFAEEQGAQGASRGGNQQ